MYLSIYKIIRTSHNLISFVFSQNRSCGFSQQRWIQENYDNVRRSLLHNLHVEQENSRCEKIVEQLRRARKQYGQRLKTHLFNPKCHEIC